MYRGSGICSTSNESKEETSGTKRKKNKETKAIFQKGHPQKISSWIEETEFMPEHFIPIQGNVCLEKAVTDRGLRILLEPIIML